MIENLLLDIGMPVWIGVGVVGAFAVASVVYGIFRNFVRMSWTSWQILLIFALTLLLKFIPVPEGWQGFAAGAGYLVGITAIVLISGLLLRRYMLKRTTRPHMFFRVCNRILGAVTSLLNILLLVVILGGFALGVMYYIVPVEGLAAVYAHPVWTQFGAVYIQDLVLISLCVLFMRGGYRIGLARSLQTVIMIALTLGSLVLAMYLTAIIPFMRSWVSAMAGSMAKGGLNLVISTLISYLIAVAITFLVFFAAIMVGGYFFNKLIRKYRSVRVLGKIDGVILSVVFTAFFLALVCGFNFCVSALASGKLAAISGLESLSGVLGSAQEIMLKLENFFTSSPLGEIFFRNNPLLLLLNA